MEDDPGWGGMGSHREARENRESEGTGVAPISTPHPRLSLTGHNRSRAPGGYPTPSIPLGIINGLGVDQLMAIVFRAVMTQSVALTNPT